MKLKIKDIIRYGSSYKLLVDYPTESILPGETFLFYLGDKEILRTAGLKPEQDIPASAATGMVLETQEDLGKLMPLNPRKNDLWLEKYVWKPNPDATVRFLVEDKPEEERKNSFFLDEKEYKP